MNYYNPYYIMNPTNTFYPSIAAGNSTGGILSRLARGFNWSSILNNTQRTLGIVNQAIPLVKQATPMINNAKTMFKIMNEFKKDETPRETAINNTTIDTKENINKEVKNDNTNYYVNNGPTFFQ